MRVWRFDHSMAVPRLVADECPEPTPKAGEVLVRVKAAGVTPSELLWYPTTHTKLGERRLLAIPGHEFSGTVAALGPETSGVSVGQDVFGMNDWFADGATADFCLTRPEWIAPKPERLTHAEAASVPIGALTAWQGLFDRAKLQAGERVLIHGGSGAVGIYAVQFASKHGAHVITTASAESKDALLQLGAAQVIDYKLEQFEDHAKNIDVVFDGVGGETLQRSWSLLNANGRVVTIAADSEATADEKTKAAFFIVELNGTQLSKIGAMLESQAIRPLVAATVPFANASVAYTGKIEQRLSYGKLVLVTE